MNILPKFRLEQAIRQQYHCQRMLHRNEFGDNMHRLVFCRNESPLLKLMMNRKKFELEILFDQSLFSLIQLLIHKYKRKAKIKEIRE